METSLSIRGWRRHCGRAAFSALLAPDFLRALSLTSRSIHYSYFLPSLSSLGWRVGGPWEKVVEFRGENWSRLLPRLHPRDWSRASSIKWAQW